VIILALFVGIFIGNFTAPNEPRDWCNGNMPKGEIGQCRAIEHWNVERDAAKKWQEAKNALEDETAKLIDERMKITCKEYGGLLEGMPEHGGWVCTVKGETYHWHYGRFVLEKDL
jgi:hypothetical protein